MNEDLIIPIYVDTNALLDLLASIEGGFSVVEKVTTRSTTTRGSDLAASAEAGTEFGIANVLNLLKIKLGGSVSRKREQEKGQETETERYHTYGSLVYRLRAYLDTQDALKRLDKGDEAWATIGPSDFVEIRGVFRPNPLADSLGVIDRLAGLMQVFSGVNLGAPMQFAKSDRKKTQDDSKQTAQIRQFIKGILSDIEKEKVRVFVVDLVQPHGYRAVVLLFTDYLRDQTMTEIGYKEYRLLGKVVRKIDRDRDEVIDLLRGTGLGGIGKGALAQLTGVFGRLEGTNLPEVMTEIAGPALEIVPIAIFV